MTPMMDDAWVGLAPAGIAALRVHPAHVIDDEDLLLLELWRAGDGGLMGGGPLPEAGGLLDQAAATLASLAVLGATAAKLREHKRGK
ncbi:MAG TPA: hypothetical protein VLA52_02075 [Thermohalobaculum sp.]|nr:hypothetical protein [Thermohalobaculum sp.]